MAGKRVSMRKIREVLRLTHELGLSVRQVREATGVGKTAVSEYVSRARGIDLGGRKFELGVEAGLGAGPGGFRNFSLHTFPSSRRPDQIWRREEAGSAI